MVVASFCGAFLYMKVHGTYHDNELNSKGIIGRESASQSNGKIRRKTIGRQPKTKKCGERCPVDPQDYQE